MKVIEGVGFHCAIDQGCFIQGWDDTIAVVRREGVKMEAEQ